MERSHWDVAQQALSPPVSLSCPASCLPGSEPLSSTRPLYGAVASLELTDCILNHEAK